MSWSGRVSITVAVLLLTGLLGPTVGATGHHVTVSHQQATPTATNNTTTQHVNPDTVSDPTDTGQTQRWLERRLLLRLERSSVELSQDEYERAQGLIGEEYESRLDQYVDVTADTQSAIDDRSASALQSARDNQSEFVETSQSYQRTYAEYERARAEGNTTAATRSARELNTLAANLTALNESLSQEYDQLGNSTGVDTNATKQRLANISANVSARQRTVQSQTLTEIRLDATANDTVAAFDNPMVVTGTVETANGTAVTNQPGVVVIGSRSYQVTTDEVGVFTLNYRPVSLPLETERVEVQYIPALSSPYLGVNDTTAVSAEEVTPSLSASGPSTELGYGDTLKLQTTVTVDGRAVPAVPVTTTFSESTTTQRTNDTGTATSEQQVPATAPVGMQEIKIAHARDGLAIGPTETTATVSIESTPTNLTVNASADAGRVYVRGQLLTDSRAGIADQPVNVTIGETQQRVTTNQSGWYQLTLSNVSVATGSTASAVPVAARFDGAGTNLEDSQAQISADFSTFLVTDSTEANQDVLLEIIATPLTQQGPLVAIVVLVVFSGALGWLRRYRNTKSSPQRTTSNPIEQQIQQVDNHGQELEIAQTALTDRNLDRAIVAAYAALRDYYEQQADIDESLTHREFIAACERELSETDSEALLTVANAYEQMTFSGVSDEAAASEAVEAATALLVDGQS